MFDNTACRSPLVRQRRCSQVRYTVAEKSLLFSLLAGNFKSATFDWERCNGYALFVPAVLRRRSGLAEFQRRSGGVLGYVCGC